MQVELVAESRTTQFGFALAVADDGQVDFFENVLELALVTPSVFAPAGDPAAVPSEVLICLR